MTQESFVKRAPEIAEGILAKVAAVPVLPENLRSFSRDLLNKEASVEEEKLQLPKRMTLDELQKLAHAKQDGLPKVADVSTDSSSEIAAELRKIAEQHERENAEDIFASAVAIVSHKKEAITAAEVGGMSAALKKLKPGKGEGWSALPWTIAGKKKRLQSRLIEEATPGSKLHGLAQETAIEKARAAASATAAKERGITLRSVGKGLGTAAAVGGGVYAGGKALEPGKEERIQVVK